MRVIAVDDERLALENILGLLREVLPEAEAEGFQRPAEALERLREAPADVALLDIEMGGMNGVALAKACKEHCPQINIIFVTGHDQYTMDALRLHASGYLIKPVRAADLRTELDNLRHPLPAAPRRRVRAQTFGSFEVFVDGKPLDLPRRKCKECLAYLIDRRGARVATAELAAVLWEDKPDGRALQNSVHRVLSDLQRALRDAGVDDLLVKTRREIAVDPDKLDCDYYGFLRGEPAQINAFRGEYMTNYSWAEFTLAELETAKPGR